MEKTNITRASKQWVERNFSSKDYLKRSIAQYKTGNVVLIGMRRLGKTEYLKYRMKIHENTTTKKVESSAVNTSTTTLSNNDVLFVDFDSPVYATIDFKTKSSSSFEAFNKTFISLLDSGEYKLVLIDEIQRRIEWNTWLKGLSDVYQGIEFIATGSDSSELNKGTESGLGRFKTLFIGPITYAEYLNMELSLDKTFVGYFDEWVFPQKEMNDDIELQYQQAYEKQFASKSMKKSNIMGVLKYIYLNPGIKLNVSRIVTEINDVFETNISSSQFNSILDFLEDSRIIFKLENKFAGDRPSKKIGYRLYVSNWNMYKIENKYSNFSELGLDSKPRAGLLFENAVIANIYSELHTPMEKASLSFYEDSKTDVDFMIGDKGFEIKSFDFIEHASKTEWEKIYKKKDIANAIIHTGETKQKNDIEFINVEEFLKEKLWKQN